MAAPLVILFCTHALPPNTRLEKPQVLFQVFGMIRLGIEPSLPDLGVRAQPTQQLDLFKQIQTMLTENKRQLIVGRIMYSFRHSLMYRDNAK